MVEWIEVDEGGCTHSHVANRRRGASVYIQHNHGSNYLLFVTRTLKTYYVDTFYTLGQAKAAGAVLYEELGQVHAIPDHWRLMSQNQSAPPKQASSLRKVASAIAQNLEDLASELSGLSKLASYQLTLEEAKAEVAADIINWIYSMVSISQNQDRFLIGAWESATRSIESKMDVHAKAKGYRRRMISVELFDSVVGPYTGDKVLIAADKARDKGKILYQPVAETFLALYIGKELEKFANTIEGFPFILKELRTAVATTWSGQGFKTTADPDTIAKIEAMAQAVAKNLAAKASKAAITLTKASL
jgi:hypothetical protein